MGLYGIASINSIRTNFLRFRARKRERRREKGKIKSFSSINFIECSWHFFFAVKKTRTSKLVTSTANSKHVWKVFRFNFCYRSINVSRTMHHCMIIISKETFLFPRTEIYNQYLTYSRTVLPNGVPRIKFKKPSKI
jgi:hypothetical protein